MNTGSSMNCRKVYLKLIDGTVLSGMTNIGTCRRLSDHLNRVDGPFLVLFDVTIEGQRQEVFFVNRSHIVWASPAQDQKCAGDEIHPSGVAVEAVVERKRG